MADNIAIKKMLDVDEQQIFPQTHVKAVIDDNGDTLEGILGNMAFLEDDSESGVTPDFDAYADSVWNKPQELTDIQKANARKNIGLESAITQSIYDISANNGGAEYSGLTEALNAIPLADRKGGMTIQYIDSSCHNYISFRNSSTTWNISDISSWIGTDSEPTAGSKNLVESGGIFNNIGAFDISELNATENPHTLATYSGLTEALNALPSEYRKGGMSVKYVQSVDNKYVEYFLTKNTWSASEADWEKVNLEEEVSQLGQKVTELGAYCTEQNLNEQFLFINIENEQAAISGGLYVYQIQPEYNAVYFKDIEGNSFGLFGIVATEEKTLETSQYGSITIVMKNGYQSASSQTSTYNIGAMSYLSYREQIIETEIQEVNDEIQECIKYDATKNKFKFASYGYVTINNIIADDSTPTYATSDWIELKAGQRIIFSASSNFIIRVYVGSNKLPTADGGYRLEYITQSSGSHNNRYYAVYTATQQCFLRASALNNASPMIEFSDDEYPSEYVEYKNGLPNDVELTTVQMGGNIWFGKKVLVIGDSLTAAGVWQQKLSSILGMTVYTHALGGAGFIQMIDGGTIGGQTLAPLSVDDVKDKDLIIIYGGYNHRASDYGEVGDLYPTQQTAIGQLQYLINGVYSLLETGSNLKCKIGIINPHCAGAYVHIPYNWDEEYPVGSGKTGETLANLIIDCANYNRVCSLDLFHTSGINKNTWNVFSASPTPETGGVVNDQLHLNSQVGYPYLGERISEWVKTI